MNNKQLNDYQQQMKKQIIELDQQIQQLETFYLQDTRQFGNILKGFENYLSTKTSRNQIISKKNKIENYQRLFSLSSIKNRINELFEQSLITNETNKIQQPQIIIPKRSRPRPGGMQKSSGKNIIIKEEIDDYISHSEVTPDNGYSKEQSGKVKVGERKKRKITKSSKVHRKI